MAGEWLKFECSLPEKPETLAITVAMGWDDPDLTVGKLMRLFRWFDQHTLDGNARGVTPALLDRIIGVSGFVAAVAETGWIVIGDTFVSLHNFDHHNGATAKGRAQTAKRVAKHKGNAETNAAGNARSVSSSLPREEKNREEVNTETPIGVLSASPPDGPPSASASRETGQPEDLSNTGQQALDGLEPPGGQGGAKPIAQVPPCPYDALIDLYEQTLPMCPTIRRGLFKDGKRAEAMRARWVWVMTGTQEVGEHAGQRMATTREEGIAWFGKFFAHVAESDFLTGRGGRWTADLEFLMTASKFAAVLEGRYHREEAHHA